MSSSYYRLKKFRAMKIQPPDDLKLQEKFLKINDESENLSHEILLRDSLNINSSEKDVADVSSSENGRNRC